MFNRKREERPKRNLAQYGLFDVPTDLSFSGEIDEMDDDDSDLEAELLALTEKSKKKPTNLDAMEVSTLKNSDSGEELSDEDDPDLLNELKELTEEPKPEIEPTKNETQTVDMQILLKNRLDMYIIAEENAQKAGETTRARRFNRGIKTIKNLMKQTEKSINIEDIPPEVSVNVSIKPPEEVITDLPQPEPPDKPQEDQEVLKMLTKRRDQYKITAVQTKRNGNVPQAVIFMKISKQFDVIIKAIENGEPVDLSQMPGPPEELPQAAPAPILPEKEENEAQGNVGDNFAETEEQEEELITADSLIEALEQRLQVYKTQEDSAKNDGNSSKARRMGRIVKQYEETIKLQKSGKLVPLEDLPTPPGYAPFPGTPPAAAATPAPTPPPPPRQNSSRKMGNQASNTSIDKQVALLSSRQKEFKQAALEAKKKGEIAQAKELLRTSKGFDKVIEAAKGGFPIDMDSLPIPSSSRSILDESFEVILAEECKEDDTETLEILTRLEQQLTKQLKLCLNTRDHHKALGDVPGVNRFENLALGVTRDLDLVRLAHKNNDSIPKYHYENKSFTIVKCCTELNDNEVELSVIRGINYNCSNPKDVDTFVKIEFPYPQAEPYKEKTVVIKDSNCPEYNATFTIPIQRTARACLRVFKRHAVKLEVYSRGGFFRGDSLLGTAVIKLQPLETQCELHDSFDLMDGRKKVGGKLEVKIRVRHPMVTRQVEHLNEKWLILN